MKINIYGLLALLVLIAVFVSYKYLGQNTVVPNTQTNTETGTSTMHIGEHSSMVGMNMSGTSVLAANRIHLDNADSYKIGKINFSFKLFGKDGDEWKDGDLKIAHEKKMHFIFVRDDMTGYQHIHPSYANGKWAVSTDIKDAGDYNLYVDIDSTEEGAMVLRVPFRVTSETKIKNFPIVNSKINIATGEYTATLTTDKSLIANQEIKLSIALTKNGKAQTDIGTYLGALGHLVILNHKDNNNFIHAHPLTEVKPDNGIIEFQATFPAKGLYTLFGQFNLDGRIILFPITINVYEGK